MLKLLSTAEVAFELHQEIGDEGQNSQVFRALDLQLNAEMAIKKIEKNKFSNIDEYFLEASLVYLSSHTNIVPIHYACQDADHVYLAMPYYDKGSLKRRMAESFLTNREIITFATQILSGLHNIHSKRLIHFNVKPSNILLSDRGEALISDFGLAKQTSYAGTAGQDRIYGKMAPPEAFQDNEFTRHFDIYQVGLTLHRMCVGDDAFYADFDRYLINGQVDRHRFRHAVLNGQFPNREQYPEHTPRAITESIRGCLQRNTNERFSSAIDVVNSLARVDGNLLDWQYKEINSGRIWHKDAGRRVYNLIVDDAQKSTATRSVNGNPARRITEFCQEAISRQDVKRFLRSH